MPILNVPPAITGANTAVVDDASTVELVVDDANPVIVVAAPANVVEVAAESGAGGAFVHADAHTKPTKHSATLTLPTPPAMT